MMLIILGMLALVFALTSGGLQSTSGDDLTSVDLGKAPLYELEAIPHRPIVLSRYVVTDEDDPDVRSTQAADEDRVPVLAVEPLVPNRTLPATPASAAFPPEALIIPVAGVVAADLVDSFGQPRGRDRRHLAIDIPAPTGTPVLAATQGEVIRMHQSAKGGITLYLTGPEGAYIYYYAHLDAYAEDLRVGDQVGQGQVIGYVGYTGNADSSMPHLHFAIWKKRAGSSSWSGSPVNPYLVLTRQESI